MTQTPPCWDLTNIYPTLDSPPQGATGHYAEVLEDLHNYKGEFVL